MRPPSFGLPCADSQKIPESVRATLVLRDDRGREIFRTQVLPRQAALTFEASVPIHRPLPARTGPLSRRGRDRRNRRLPTRHHDRLLGPRRRAPRLRPASQRVSRLAPQGRQSLSRHRHDLHGVRRPPEVSLRARPSRVGPRLRDDGEARHQLRPNGRVDGMVARDAQQRRHRRRVPARARCVRDDGRETRDRRQLHLLRLPSSFVRGNEPVPRPARARRAAGVSLDDRGAVPRRELDPLGPDQRALVRSSGGPLVEPADPRPMGGARVARLGPATSWRRSRGHPRPLARRERRAARAPAGERSRIRADPRGSDAAEDPRLRGVLAGGRRGVGGGSAKRAAGRRRRGPRDARAG